MHGMKKQPDMPEPVTINLCQKCNYAAFKIGQREKCPQCGQPVYPFQPQDLMFPIQVDNIYITGLVGVS